MYWYGDKIFFARIRHLWRWGWASTDLQKCSLQTANSSLQLCKLSSICPCCSTDGEECESECLAQWTFHLLTNPELCLHRRWWLLVAMVSASVGSMANHTLVWPNADHSKCACIWSEKPQLISQATVKYLHILDNWTVANNKSHQCGCGKPSGINPRETSHMKTSCQFYKWSQINADWVNAITHKHTYIHKNNEVLANFLFLILGQAHRLWYIYLSTNNNFRKIKWRLKFLRYYLNKVVFIKTCAKYNLENLNLVMISKFFSLFGFGSFIPKINQR